MAHNSNLLAVGARLVEISDKVAEAIAEDYFDHLSFFDLPHFNDNFFWSQLHENWAFYTDVYASVVFDVLSTEIAKSSKWDEVFFRNLVDKIVDELMKYDRLNGEGLTEEIANDCISHNEDEDEEIEEYRLALRDFEEQDIENEDEQTQEEVDEDSIETEQPPHTDDDAEILMTSGTRVDRILSELKIHIAGYSIDEECILSLLREYLISPGVKGSSDQARVQIFDYVDPALYKLILNDPSLLNSLDWRVFEKLLADIIERCGYRVELTRGSKDGGIDIFAFGQKSHFGNEKYIIQAKRSKNVITVEPVRELMFLHHHEKASKACLVTTSTFSKGAWEIANLYQWQLELKDNPKLLEWIKEAEARRQ